MGPSHDAMPALGVDVLIFLQTDFELIEYAPKTWEETDVELQITHCGVCGSDIHTIHPEGWKNTMFPAVVG